MQSLLESIAISYAKSKGLDYITDEAREYAAKKLGLDKQQGNPKYAISLMGQSFNPIDNLKRAGLNQGIKSLMGGKLGGMLGPGLLMGGALMLGRAFDPTRPGSRNYNPNLAGQIDYASGRGYIGRNPGSGLQQYSNNSVLSGQNVQSMFGTNDYQKQLQNKIDKLQAKKTKGYNTFLGKKTTNFSKGQQDELDKALKEKDEFVFEKKQTTQEDYRTDQYKDNSDGGGGGTQAGGFTAQDDARESYSRYKDGGRINYKNGGIASL